MGKELLVIGKFVSEKDKNEKKYYLSCLKLVPASNEKPNRILRNITGDKMSDYLVRVSSTEYDGVVVGDIWSYSSVVNEYERIELVIETLQRNIFGKIK